MNTCEPVVATREKRVPLVRCTKAELDRRLREMVAESLDRMAQDGNFASKPRAERRRIARLATPRIAEHCRNVLVQKVADGTIEVL